MSIEQLTYAALAERLNCSPEAARSLAKRLRLPRQRGNDGKTLVAIDVAEIKHRPLPARSPAGHGPDGATLRAKITELENKFAQLEIVAGDARSPAGHDPDGATLRAKITELENKFAQLEIVAGDARSPAGHDPDGATLRAK